MIAVVASKTTTSVMTTIGTTTTVRLRFMTIQDPIHVGKPNFCPRKDRERYEEAHSVSHTSSNTARTSPWRPQTGSFSSPNLASSSCCDLKVELTNAGFFKAKPQG
jgi:hypothetical protein